MAVRMTWLRIDDKFCKHEKIEHLSDRAFRLHVSALCLCADELTDGRISERALRQLAALVRMSSSAKYVTELIAANLWSVHDRGGWKINDYLDYNPSSTKVKEDRARNARRQNEWRGRNAQSNALRNDVSNADHNAAPSRPQPEDSKYGSLYDAEVLDITIGRAI